MELPAVGSDASSQDLRRTTIDLHAALTAAVCHPIDQVILRVAAEAADLDLVLDHGVSRLAERFIEAASFVGFRGADEEGDAIGQPLAEGPKELFQSLLDGFGTALHRVLQEGDPLHPDKLAAEEGESTDRPDRLIDHLNRAVDRIGRELDGLHAELPCIGRGELCSQILGRHADLGLIAPRHEMKTRDLLGSGGFAGGHREKAKG